MKLATCARQLNGRSTAPELGAGWLEDKLWCGAARQWLNSLLSEEGSRSKPAALNKGNPFEGLVPPGGRVLGSPPLQLTDAIRI